MNRLEQAIWSTLRLGAKFRLVATSSTKWACRQNSPAMHRPLAKYLQTFCFTEGLLGLYISDTWWASGHFGSQHCPICACTGQKTCLGWRNSSALCANPQMNPFTHPPTKLYTHIRVLKPLNWPLGFMIVEPDSSFVWTRIHRVLQGFRLVREQSNINLTPIQTKHWFH